MQWRYEYLISDDVLISLFTHLMCTIGNANVNINVAPFEWPELSFKYHMNIYNALEALMLSLVTMNNKSCKSAASNFLYFKNFRILLNSQVVKFL